MSESLAAKLLAVLKKDEAAKINTLRATYPSDHLGKSADRQARGKRGVRRGRDS